MKLVAQIILSISLLAFEWCRTSFKNALLGPASYISLYLTKL